MAKTVLLVEDELIIGFGLADALAGLGYRVVGPVPDFDGALAWAARTEIDGAVLDIQLGREEVYPAADLLRARRIPFLFTTGRPTWTLPERFRTAPVLTKPFEPADVAAIAAATFGAAAAPAREPQGPRSAGRALEAAGI